MGSLWRHTLGVLTAQTLDFFAALRWTSEGSLGSAPISTLLNGMFYFFKQRQTRSCNLYVLLFRLFPPPNRSFVEVNSPAIFVIPICNYASVNSMSRSKYSLHRFIVHSSFQFSPTFYSLPSVIDCDRLTGNPPEEQR